MKVKRGDTVLVIAGKDRGVKGKVLAVSPDTGKVVVEGVNRVKKHEKLTTTGRGAKAGGITTQEAAVHISNVMVVDSEGAPTRVGYRRNEETGRNIRVSRKSKGKDIDQ
jgi:large subunit ribosomal protein L24